MGAMVVETGLGYDDDDDDDVDRSHSRERVLVRGSSVTLEVYCGIDIGIG